MKTSVGKTFVGIAQTQSSQTAVWMSLLEMEILCGFLNLTVYPEYQQEAVLISQQHCTALIELSNKLCHIVQGLKDNDTLLFVPVTLSQSNEQIQLAANSEETDDLDPELNEYRELIRQ